MAMVLKEEVSPVRKSISNVVKTMPLGPGVYMMEARDGQVLYIGKASSLRKRVLSYFSKRTSLKTGILIEHVERIKWIECDSQEQALILEAALIKEKKPRYNVALRDDKSYPYIEITTEEFPRVFISRPKARTKSLLFGPYPKVKIVKSALNLIRKVFPYCSCKGIPKRPCLFFHLNLCPAPFAGYISRLNYKENIEGIIRILKGERQELIRDIRKRMEAAVKGNKFEEAALFRDRLFAIENLYRGRSLTHELLALKEMLHLSSLPLHIEAIDISALGGKEAAGSVVVFRCGSPDKNSYRRYRIKQVPAIDDYAMIGEVVSRRYLRLKNENIKLPDLIIIDGGKGHAQRAREELNRLSITIPLIGIAKRNEEIWYPEKSEPLIIPKDHPSLHLIQRLRDEAHRFARKYHLLLRSKK